MVALLAYRQRNRQSVLLRRQRTRSKRCIGARRILEPVEIEHQFTSLVQAMVGEPRVQKPASAISCRATGRVAQNEKQFGCRRVFQNGVYPVCLSLQSELSGAWHLRRVAGPDQRRDRERLLRRVGNPTRRHTVGFVRCVPLQPVKTSQRRGLSVLDPQRKSLP